MTEDVTPLLLEEVSLFLLVFLALVEYNGGGDDSLDSLDDIEVVGLRLE